MKLYLQYGEALLNKWESLCEIELAPLVSISPQAFTETQMILGLNLVPVTLPNGEVLNIDVTYSMENRGINIRVLSEGNTLIQVGGFKRQETSCDPNILFRTLQGIHISIMIGV